MDFDTTIFNTSKEEFEAMFIGDYTAADYYEFHYGPSSDTSLDLAELIRNRKLSFKRARRFASRRAI